MTRTVYVCDRCHDNLKSGLNYFTNDAYRVRTKDAITFELCPNCVKELIKWVGIQ